MDFSEMQSINYKWVLFLLFAIMQSACTSFPSENVDPSKNNKDVFRKDLAECKLDYGESTTGVHFKQWTDCMNLKGWK